MSASRSALRNFGFLTLASLLGAGTYAWLDEHSADQAHAQTADSPAIVNQQIARAADVSLAFNQAAETLEPSVVSISSIKRARVRSNRRPTPQDIPEQFRPFFEDDMFNRFFQFDGPQREYEQQGQGTGVIISRDGYVLTNNHVVDGADELTVTLFDNRELKAAVVGTDPKTDLAVLKVDAQGLVAARLGDRSDVSVGQWVLAIGSPFGLKQTVTAGIVSAVGRANVGITDYEDFIQTDAAINPGNSGGPLVNLQGEVIGINTAIASRSGGYMGIGFAIPMRQARSIIDAIIEKGHVDRGWLGAAIQDLTKELADSFNFRSETGVLISDVVPDGPAAKAGIRSGDIVMEINKVPLRDANHLRNVVAATQPDSMANLTIFRDGKPQRIQVRIGLLPTDPRLAALDRGTDDDGNAPAEEKSLDELGLTGQSLTAETAEALGYNRNEKGFVITGVSSGGLAQRAGLRRGDVVVSADGQDVRSAADFSAALEDASLADGLRLQLKRDGFRRFVIIRSNQ
ncbi:MAG: DegQ family serine endoprotease [Planctomycetales bacterium]|nr:DegQ family serine endoprotease [Planctomycetales bacterium]